MINRDKLSEIIDGLREYEYVYIYDFNNDGNLTVVKDCDFDDNEERGYILEGDRVSLSNYLYNDDTKDKNIDNVLFCITQDQQEKIAKHLGLREYDGNAIMEFLNTMIDKL